jgi:hypothetical protein
MLISLGLLGYNLTFFLLMLLCLIIQLDNLLSDHMVFAKNDDRESKDDDDDEDNDDEDNDDDRESKDDDDRESEYIPRKEANSKFDVFGVEKIYPSKKGGEEWFMNMYNVFDDPQFYPYGITASKAEDLNLIILQNDDGSWNLKSKDNKAKVRMNVHTSEGYRPDKIETFDHSKLADHGYIQSEKDWKNVEMTGYIKLNNNNIPLSEGRFTWYTRGGHHTDNEACEGVAYKGDIFFSGDTRFAKEQWHVSYFFTDIKSDLKPIKGKWIGYKFVLYNIEDSFTPSKTIVKMESWIDYNNNGKWVKVNEFIDKGDWGNSGKKCDGKKDQIITWGGPIATFRWDKADDVDFKNFSVREIYPL